jgi:DNA-binding CsgD family transcriptional regulator/catechol 2,3-dioxygenase-like lactoylglutathione lyase family enzyme
MMNKRGRGRPAHPDVLTPGEWRVVEAVRHGMSNREIARRRGVSLDAVKYHLGNAVGKLGLPGRKALRAWGGIRRGSPLHGKEADMSASVELGAIGQIARSVKDIGEAVAWHRDVLGLKHLYTFGKLAFFDCGGVRLYLDENGGAADSVIYFRVPDILSAHGALQARGIEFVSPPHLIHRHADGLEEWMAFFKDNEGRTLGIMSQVVAQAETAGR